MKTQFTEYIHEQNAKGSNKATSYIRALNLLDGILKNEHLLGLPDFWSVNSIDKVKQLYQHALAFQKEDGSEYLAPELPQSYARNGYYSSALKSYKEFLVLSQHEQILWNLASQSGLSPSELSLRLCDQNVDSIEELIDDPEFRFSSPTGKEVLRETKSRVNQGFFRKLVLSNYETSCCVTGLSIPQVLRASHIVAWAEDEDNRMNPANGLCLSATYDSAFDRHLLSFDEDYRMIFSSELKEYADDNAFKKYFSVFEGSPITRPKRFLPDQNFLEKHRAKMSKI